MKNIFKKSIIVITLCLMVILICKNEVSANESHSLTIKNPYTTATVSGEWKGTLEDAEADKLATDTGKEVCFIANMNYDNTDMLGTEMCGEIIRIDTPAKCNVSIEVTGLDVEKNVQFATFNSEDASEKVWEKPIVVDWFASNRVNTGETFKLCFAYEKKTTRYLVVKSDKSAEDFSNSIQIKITCYVSLL